MKINKIRPKFIFLTKIEKKMAHLVFLFIFYCLFFTRAIWKPFYLEVSDFELYQQ